MGYDIGTYVGTATDLAEDAVAAYNGSDLNQFQTADLTFVGASAKFGPNQTGPSGEASSTTPGTAAGSAVTPQVCALVRKITGSGGRAGRGRLYFPGIPEAQVSPGGLLGNTTFDGLHVAWADVAATMSLAGAASVVLHGAGSPISTPTPITGFLTAIRCATQRRRNRPD
jgi:hypothetical protein